MSTQPATAATAEDPAAQDEKSRSRGSWRPYQLYVLGLMTLVVMCNYMDRGVLALLQEAIKAELKLSDSQLGLLGGPAFGLFFALCGIPVARLAERTHRARLLAACAALWSLMTAACGTATSFVQLGLARMGVGAGEGGAVPISQSLLADTFTLRQRGIVMSVVSAATPIAGIVTPLIVPPVVAIYGWRAGFYVLGFPGLLLALLVVLTVTEPRDKRAVEGAPPRKKGTFFADMGWLLRNGPFMFLFVAGACIGIGVNSVGLFKASFLMRAHGYSLQEAGAIWSLAGLVGLGGTFVGGYMADRFADARGRSYVLTPAVGSLLTFIVYLTAFSVGDPMLAAGLLILAQFTYNLKNGPIYAAVQNIVPSHMRATGAAMHMLAATTVGSMVGPTVSGFLSDSFAAGAFGTDTAAYLAACPGGKAVAGAAAETVAACKSASAVGLQHALKVISGAFLISCVMCFLAARNIRVAEPDS